VIIKFRANVRGEQSHDSKDLSSRGIIASPNHARQKRRCRCSWLSGSYGDGRKPEREAGNEPSTSIIIYQRLADNFCCSVGRFGCRYDIVRHDFRERLSVYGLAGGINESHTGGKLSCEEPQATNELRRRLLSYQARSWLRSLKT